MFGNQSSTYLPTETGLAQAPSASRAWLVAAMATAWGWNERRLSRLVLANLADHELADIGLTRAEARYESEKPFWSI